MQNNEKNTGLNMQKYTHMKIKIIYGIINKVSNLFILDYIAGSKLAKMFVRHFAAILANLRDILS